MTANSECHSDFFVRTRLTSILVSHASCSIFSIYYGYEVWVDRSVTRVIDRYHEACFFYPHLILMIDTLLAYLLLTTYDYKQKT